MIIRIDYLIYVYMTLCLCMLGYNLFYLGKNKWMQKRTAKQIRDQTRRLKTFLLFPERSSPKVDDEIKKKLTHTHQLVVLEGTIEALHQNPLTTKQLQEWLPTLKPAFIQLIDVYMKKSVMERSYFAYLVMRFGLCGEGANDPLSTMMIQLTALSSIYCRENALMALYAHGSVDHIVKAYRLMARHEIEHSRKLVSDGLLEFHGDREQLARALWQNWTEFTPHYQVAFIDFIRMISGNFREVLMPLLTQPETDREVKFAVMRYFRKYPYAPAGMILRQTVSDWEKQDWEYAAIAAASLESYPGKDTMKALLIGIQSDNWYVRDNASDSLLQLAAPQVILEIIHQLKDSYGREMLRYKAVSAGLLRVRENSEELEVAAGHKPVGQGIKTQNEFLNAFTFSESSAEELPPLQKWGTE